MIDAYLQRKLDAIWGEIECLHRRLDDLAAAIPNRTCRKLYLCGVGREEVTRACSRPEGHRGKCGERDG